MKQWEAAKAARDAERKKQKEEAEAAAFRQKQEEAKKKEEGQKVALRAAADAEHGCEEGALLFDAWHSWPSCRKRASRQRMLQIPKGKEVLGPKLHRWLSRPPSSGDLRNLKHVRQLTHLRCRATRDSFTVFRESKALAKQLAPLTKKSEVLDWMRPIWARQQLDAFLFDCHKVPPIQCIRQPEPG